MFLSAWATDAAIGVALLSCSPRDPYGSYYDECSGVHRLGKMYFIPIATPLYVGGVSVVNDPGNAAGWVSLVTGTAQAVGAGLWLASSLLGPEPYLVPDAPMPSSASTVLAPASFGPGSAGVSMSGTF